MKNLFKSLLIVCLFTVFAITANAEDQNKVSDNQTENWHEEVAEAEYNAGESIIEHLVDSYEWHIATVGHTHISIPLPIILYHKGEWHFFMSDKFKHGDAIHNGFRIASEGPNKGKVIRVIEEDLLKGNIIEDVNTHEIPWDFSITKNVVAILLSCIFLVWILVSVAKAYRRREGKAPKGLQSFIEPIIIFVRDDIAKSSIGEKNYKRFLPYLLTIFFFILINNLLGLVPFFPGGANVTGNIGVAAVLALFTFAMTTFSGNKNYWMHIFNTPGVPWWLKFPIPLMPIVELMGVITKPFVLMVRLFANITAGHIIILGFISLIFIFGAVSAGLGLGVSVFSVFFAVFMSLLELLVAFIQAYVFTLLSAIYLGMATEEHH
ncbi:MAG: F0F1 ATP synthase subunit A [Hyphomicrobiales bacterium]